jgi:replication-associated recombination protein RarA
LAQVWAKTNLSQDGMAIVTPIPFDHSSLSTYQAPSLNFPIEKGRKWELVSGLQKTIRRADKATALKLISGIASTPEEYAYFWRRMCVIACEDSGI